MLRSSQKRDKNTKKKNVLAIVRLVDVSDIMKNSYETRNLSFASDAQTSSHALPLVHGNRAESFNIFPWDNPHPGTPSPHLYFVYACVWNLKKKKERKQKQTQSTANLQREINQSRAKLIIISLFRKQQIYRPKLAAHRNCRSLHFCAQRVGQAKPDPERNTVWLLLLVLFLLLIVGCYCYKFCRENRKQREREKIIVKERYDAQTERKTTRKPIQIFSIRIFRSWVIIIIIYLFKIERILFIWLSGIGKYCTHTRPVLRVQSESERASVRGRKSCANGRAGAVWKGNTVTEYSRFIGTNENNYVV